MKILYIFPHPDDESFGPAPAISAQVRAGHRVYLLTLTKGEATRQRHRLNVSKQKMGEIRFHEMLCVEKVLGLAGMTVLDLPDSGLKEMNPLHIEKAVEEHVKKVRPDVLVTYAVHGISGFHDHLVCHAVVKRSYCKFKESGSGFPRRLAFFTRSGEIHTDGKFRLEASSDEEIDCIVPCDEEDMDKFHQALDCYETYQEVIRDSNVKKVVGPEVPFEFFGESMDPPVGDLVEKL